MDIPSLQDICSDIIARNLAAAANIFDLFEYARSSGNERLLAVIRRRIHDRFVMLLEKHGLDFLVEILGEDAHLLYQRYQDRIASEALLKRRVQLSILNPTICCLNLATGVCIRA